MAKFYRKDRAGQRVWREWCRLVRDGKVAIKPVRKLTPAASGLRKLLRREAT